jgi:hypothetical protein
MKIGQLRLCIAVCSIVLATAVSNAASKSIDFGRYHALLIANQNYTYWDDLKTPYRDVKEIKNILKNRYGFHDVQVLKDATRDDIIDKLEEYSESLTSSDNLLIYYAGHGKLRKDGGYWVGVDANERSSSRWLHFRKISDLIYNLQAKHVMVIADSCYAGAMVRRDEEDLPKKKSNESEQAWFARMHKKPSRTALTSGGTEPVLDHAGSSKYSIFAEELIRQLKYNDEVLQADSLYDRIKSEVHARARRVVGSEAQAPEYDPIPGTGHTGGDFLFVPKGVMLQAPLATSPTTNDFGIKGKSEPNHSPPAREYVDISQDGRFIKYKDGVVRDNKTGLEWVAGPDKGTHWHQAKSWVDGLYIDGGGWRMPSIEELEALHQWGISTNNITPLLETTGNCVWSEDTRIVVTKWFKKVKNYYYIGLSDGTRSSSPDNIGPVDVFRAFAVRPLNGK